MRIELEYVKRSDPRYQAIRNRHYIPNRGTHGQQLHFLILLEGRLIGIISGASSVYGVAARDAFFNIPSDAKIKQRYYLPAIINNTVFRLEEHRPNLATQVLAKFRRVVARLWEELYQVPVIGFETFVIETPTRKGALYKADNWTLVGQTKGSTKQHRGLENKSTRVQTEEKLIYCRWIQQDAIIPTVAYQSSWRAETLEEKARKKRIEIQKKEWLGTRF